MMESSLGTFLSLSKVELSHILLFVFVYLLLGQF